MEKTFVRQIIKCPHCNYEYLPSDLFMPGDFIGRTDSVIRDALGKIIYEDYYKGEEPNQTVPYICDGCGKSFIVEATTVYKAKNEEEEKDFSEPYVSLLD